VAYGEGAVVVLACNIWRRGHGPMASTVVQAYNGGLGAEPPARSRGRTLVRGSRGKAP